MQPLPPPDESWALFLDIDGTLADIEDHPDDVVVATALKDTLVRLADRLAGAVAIVSGRPIAQIDSLLAPLRLAAAGLHGLEHRQTPAARATRAPRPSWLDDVRADAEAVAGAHAGAWVEDKKIAVALHYRAAPAAEGDALALAARTATAPLPGLAVQRGKMVVEFRPDAADKGRAIAAFLSAPPFAGRRPVFVGDDVTDEDGFRAVKAAGGIAIRVGGDEPTAADWRLATVGAAHDWLARVAETLGRTAAAR